MTALSNTKAPVPAQKKTGSWKSMVAKDWKKHWPLYLLILPLIAYYLLWCYGPLYGIVIAFNNFSPKKGIFGSAFVGFKWFADFFNGPYAFRVIRNTVLINVWNLLWGFPTPIILALMLNELRNRAFKRTVQTITYMPYFISVVIISGMLRDFTASDGVFGTITKLFGGTPTNLLANPNYFQTIYVASEVWQRIGWDSIIFLSALSAISPELYEAATIDGAGKIKQVIHVTLPGIMSTIAILLVLRIGSLMALGFEKIILLYNGLTYETADVISSYVYRKGIVEANFSFATAVNLFQSVINFALVIFANRMSRRLSETSLW